MGKVLNEKYIFFLIMIQEVYHKELVLEKQLELGLRISYVYCWNESVVRLKSFNNWNFNFKDNGGVSLFELLL